MKIFKSLLEREFGIIMNVKVVVVEIPFGYRVLKTSLKS